MIIRAHDPHNDSLSVMTIGTVVSRSVQGSTSSRDSDRSAHFLQQVPWHPEDPLPSGEVYGQASPALMKGQRPAQHCAWFFMPSRGRPHESEVGEVMEPHMTPWHFLADSGPSPFETQCFMSMVK